MIPVCGNAETLSSVSYGDGLVQLIQLYIVLYCQCGAARLDDTIILIYKNQYSSRCPHRAPLSS